MRITEWIDIPQEKTINISKSRARKDYLCKGCGGIIERGTVYYYIVQSKSHLCMKCYGKNPGTRVLHFKSKSPVFQAREPGGNWHDVQEKT